MKKGKRTSYKILLTSAILLIVFGLTFLGLDCAVITFDTEKTILQNIERDGMEFFEAKMVVGAQERFDVRSINLNLMNGYIRSTVIDLLDEKYQGMSYCEEANLRLFSYDVHDVNKAKPYKATGVVLRSESDVTAFGLSLAEGAVELDADSVYMTDALLDHLTNYYTVGHSGTNPEQQMFVKDNPIFTLVDGEYVRAPRGVDIYSLAGQMLYSRQLVNSRHQFTPVAFLAGIIETDYAKKLAEYEKMSAVEKRVFDSKCDNIYFRFFCNEDFYNAKRHAAVYQGTIELNNSSLSGILYPERYNSNYEIEVLVVGDDDFVIADVPYMSIKRSTNTENADAVTISLLLYNSLFGTNLKYEDVFDGSNSQSIVSLDHIGESISIKVKDASGQTVAILNNKTLVNVYSEYGTMGICVNETDFERFSSLTYGTDALLISSQGDKGVLVDLMRDLRKEGLLVFAPYSASVYSFERMIPDLTIAFSVVSAVLVIAGGVCMFFVLKTKSKWTDPDFKNETAQRKQSASFKSIGILSIVFFAVCAAAGIVLTICAEFILNFAFMKRFVDGLFLFGINGMALLYVFLCAFTVYVGLFIALGSFLRRSRYKNQQTTG